jgi:hypothetical protein
MHKLGSLVQVKIVQRPLHTKFKRPPKNVGIFLAKLVLSSNCVDVYMAKLNASVQTLTIGGFRAAVTDITRPSFSDLELHGRSQRWRLAFQPRYEQA